MICLRCGYCCLKHLVVVVKDPGKGPAEDNLLTVNGDCDCPHLEKDDLGTYRCLVHDYPWYGDTPCAKHVQVESKNSPCRMGEYFLSKASKKKQNGDDHGRVDRVS